MLQFLKRFNILKNSATVTFLLLPALAIAGNRSVHNQERNMSSLLSPKLAPSWDFAADEIVSLAQKAIDEGTKFYDSVASLETPDLENFVVAVIDHEDETDGYMSQLTFLQHVSADKEVRDASIEATKLIQEWGIETSSRHDLYSQFSKVWEQYKDDENLKKNDPELYWYMENVNKDYIHAGMGLPEESRNKIKEIKKKLANNSLAFSNNLGEQNDYIAFTKDELVGVSETTLGQFEKVIEDGVEKYKMTFKYPDIHPVLNTAKNPETRKRAYIGDQNKVPQNEQILIETLKLRNELAEIHGHPTYASYQLEMKMAKKQETVFNFLYDLKDKLLPGGKKDLENLKSLKEQEYKELGLPYNGSFNSWDYRYYDDKYLKENFDVDEEELAKYFPLQHTIDGMLNIYQKLFNLKFVEETRECGKNVWHEDVKQFAVWNLDDKCNPEFVGWIYFDLHPREGKYGHAANFGLYSPYVTEEGTRHYPVTVLVCNFSKPSSTRPALLKHGEVVTFFHELGHGIHALVGKSRIGHLNGPSSIPWDFVEAPSQMLEFWPWNKDQILKLSKHYETGEQIPDELVDSLIKTKHVNAGLSNLRQLHFSLFDMTVHTDKELDKLDIKSLWNNLREEVTLISNGDVLTKGYDSFSHIMSGYSAGYYGYMWSEVFAADMYHTMFAPNPLDTSVGTRYRDIILAKGGLRDIEDSLEEFLGREPNNKAFLKELGL